MIHPQVTILAERNMTARRIIEQAAGRTRGPAAPPASLPALAAAIVTGCEHNGFPAATFPLQQVLCLAEETGEFVGAYRRWTGLARRPGTFTDVTAELADVLIAAHVVARVLRIDLDAAWRAKATVILTCGWRQPPPAA